MSEHIKNVNKYVCCDLDKNGKNMGKYEKFKLEKEFLDKHMNDKVTFGFNGLGHIVYLRTYSRLKEDGKKECWFDTVQRVVEGTFDIQCQYVNYIGKQWNMKKANKSSKKMFKKMFNMKFSPPGRGLFAMGTKIPELKGGAALNNCGYVSTKNLRIDPISPFIRLMYCAMCGVGMGFDVEGEGEVTVLLPKEEETYYTIEDSREGWVKSVDLLLRSYFYGTNTCVFDYSEIRKEGAPLKIFGGVSSGPAPLFNAHESLGKTLMNNANKPITVTTIVDIMNILGKCVVAGGIRRTAEIALGRSSEEFLNLKNYEDNPERMAWGWTSNNSVLSEIGDNYDDIANRIMNNGEPGLCWLENMRKYSRMNDVPDNKDQKVDGANPCVVGSTLVNTTNGICKAIDLLGKDFSVVINNEEYVCNYGFFSTGRRPVYELTTEHGYSVRLTEDHKVLTIKENIEIWTKAKNLIPGDLIKIHKNNVSTTFDDSNKFDYGWLIGVTIISKDIIIEDNIIINNIRNNKIKLGFEDKLRSINNESTNYNIFYEKINEYLLNDDKDVDDVIYKTDIFTQIGIIRGAYDVNGNINTQSNIIEITMYKLQHAHILQQMLINIGVCSKLTFNNTNNENNMRQNTMCYGLLIEKSNVATFMNKICPYNRNVINELRIYNNKDDEEYVTKVKSFSYIGIEDVYDCTINNVHCFPANGLIVHNCCEQSLEDGELCNLVEVFIDKHESLEEYLETLKYAFLYAKTVTLVMTHDKETNEIIKRNRRIGVSISGVAQFLAKNSLDTLKCWLEIGYKKLQYYDSIYSKWLEIPESIKITSNKPGGSVCCVVGSTSGLSDPISRWMIRRVRMDLSNELLNVYEKNGYNVVRNIEHEENTGIIEIPIDMGEGIRASKDVPMWEQLSRCAFFQKHWADNQVSATIMFDREIEGTQISKALDYFQYQLKGISFLPRSNSGYKYMPYEEITEEVYNNMTNRITNTEILMCDNEDPEQEAGCDGEKCIINSLKKL